MKLSKLLRVGLFNAVLGVCLLQGKIEGDKANATNESAA